MVEKQALFCGKIQIQSISADKNQNMLLNMSIVTTVRQ